MVDRLDSTVAVCPGFSEPGVMFELIEMISFSLPISAVALTVAIVSDPEVLHPSRVRDLQASEMQRFSVFLRPSLHVVLVVLFA